MALFLFDHPLSPYAQKVKIACLEKGIEYQTTLPNGLGSGQRVSDFQAASPRGEVPALVDGDVNIFDSTVILEYLEDKWPKPPLLPDAPAERARARMIEDAMDTHYEAISWGLSEITNFGRAEGALREQMLRTGGEQTQRWFAWLEAQLGNNDFFTGGRFSRADLSVIPYLNGSRGFGLEPKPDSALTRWAARMNERASVKQCVADIAAMARNTDPTAGLAQVRELIQSGQFKREYRDHRLEWMIKTGGLSVVAEGLQRNNIRFTDEFKA